MVLYCWHDISFATGVKVRFNHVQLHKYNPSYLVPDNSLTKTLTGMIINVTEIVKLSLGDMTQ